MDTSGQIFQNRYRTDDLLSQGGMGAVYRAWNLSLNIWYDSGYYGRSPDRNPTGPDSGQYRALQGDSWSNVSY